MSPLEWLFFAMAAIGTLYYIFSTLALVAHFRKGIANDACKHAEREAVEVCGCEETLHESSPHPSTELKMLHPFTPYVSILKPINGLDSNLEANLRTFMQQDYPDYETLFGVLNSDDPALPLLRQLSSAHTFVGSEIQGANNKVRILDTLARHAQGEILVITDADTRVEPSFLQKITAPFVDENVGAVTCLYRGIGACTVADKIEGLHMTCVFAPGVASHAALAGIDFGLGAAIAIRKETLERMGGFAEIVDYLADDFQLGRGVSKTGYRMELSGYVIEIKLGGESLRNVLERELRWSVTTRISRPWGHLGLIFTFGFVYALALVPIARFSTWAWVALLLVALVRFITAWIGASLYLGDREVFSRLYLLPIRDLLSFGIWVAGYFTRKVKWRGRLLRVVRRGKVEVV